MADRRLSWTKIIHYAVVGILVIGGGLYWLLKPASVNPLSDPRAAEAMALVQTHRALGAPSIRQAIDQHLRRFNSENKLDRLRSALQPLRQEFDRF